MAAMCESDPMTVEQICTYLYLYSVYFYVASNFQFKRLGLGCLKGPAPHITVQL